MIQHRLEISLLNCQLCKLAKEEDIVRCFYESEQARLSLVRDCKEINCKSSNALTYFRFHYNKKYKFQGNEVSKLS